MVQEILTGAWVTYQSLHHYGKCLPFSHQLLMAYPSPGAGTEIFPPPGGNIYGSNLVQTEDQILSRVQGERDQGAGPLKEGAERSSEVSPEEHGSGSALGLHYYPCFQLYLFEAETPARAWTPSVSSGSRYSQTKATSTHVLCSVIELKQNWLLEHYKASETSLSLLCRLHCKPGTWSRLLTLHWDSCQQEPELQCESWALT